MTPRDRDYLYQLLKEQSGLILTGDKDYLIESRLMPVARRHGLSSISELIAKVRQADTATIQREINEAMTTNETFFFRDKAPFESFNDVMIPEIQARNRDTRKIRIWCAAASTGQEPYSLAICLREMSERLSGWQVEILATDLSVEVLEKAKTGIYSQFEVQRGLPIQMLMSYFTQSVDMWQIDAALRNMVTFREFNLLDSFSPLGQFDIIFCRNALIYFDQPQKTELLAKFHGQLQPNGYLVLGATETVLGLTNKFQSVPGKYGQFVPVSSENEAIDADGISGAA